MLHIILFLSTLFQYMKVDDLSNLMLVETKWQHNMLFMFSDDWNYDTNWQFPPIYNIFVQPRYILVTLMDEFQGTRHKMIKSWDCHIGNIKVIKSKVGYCYIFGWMVSIQWYTSNKKRTEGRFWTRHSYKGCF